MCIPSYNWATLKKQVSENTFLIELILHEENQNVKEKVDI